MFYLSSWEDHAFPNLQFKANQSIMRGFATYPLYVERYTNYAPMQYLMLPFDQTYDFHLFDDKGREVQKTEQGLANSKPAHSPRNMKEYERLRPSFFAQNGGTKFNALFRPEDMFVITNKGGYTMEIRMSICVQVTTNGTPDYEALQNLKITPHGPFGIVVSKPLRVKVTKE